ncbi:MAG: hypothetical protein C0623_05370, partial [Desulfuromonas sp.]
MKSHWYRFLIGICILFATAMPASAGVGVLDPAFSLDGKLDPLNANNPAYGHSIAVQSSGGIVVAGHTSFSGDTDVVVRRYGAADGALDTTFGTGGDARLVLSGNDVVTDMVLQDDDKIVVAGYHNDGSQDDTLIVRFNADGSLDTTFNSTGYLADDFSGSLRNDQVHGIVIDGSGNIVFSGWTVVTANGDNDVAVGRLTSTGQFDNSFDNDGKLSFDVGATYAGGAIIPVDSDDTANGIGVLSSANADRIVLGGHSDNAGTNTPFFVSLNSDGSFDTNFSTALNGFYVFGGYEGSIYDLVVNEFDEIVAAGSMYNNFDTVPSLSNDAALIRMTAAGDLDSNFSSTNTPGVVLVDFDSGSSGVDDSSDDAFYSVSYMDFELKYLASGVTTPFSGTVADTDFLFARFLNDGLLDPDGSYDVTAGEYSSTLKAIDFLGNADQSGGVAFDAIGRLLVSGYQTSLDGTDIDFAAARLDGGMYGVLAVNNNFPKTASLNVTLSIDCQSTVGNTITKMCIQRWDDIWTCRHQDDPAYDDTVWQAYSATAPAVLYDNPDDKSGETPQEFYVTCMDEFGNISETYSDSIILDNVPPYLTIDVVSPVIDNSPAVDQQVSGNIDSGITVTVSVSSEPNSSVDTIEYYYDDFTGSGPTWHADPNPSPTAAPEQWRAWVRDLQYGDNVVQAYAKDYLGNIAVSRGTISLFNNLGTSNDTDGDGMIDSYEIFWGFYPNNPADGGTSSVDYYVTLQNIDINGVPISNSFPDLTGTTGNITLMSPLFTGYDCTVTA